VKVIGGSQDKCLKFYTVKGELIKKVENAHDDIIRDIKVLEGIIYTCSNDGLVKIWSLDGDHISTLTAH
jgi:hypothetical protein